MGFLGVYSAVYDYQPQGEGELAIREGDLLYILEKNAEDGWWKAKKKADREDEDEPEGLVPNNYVEEVSLLRRSELHTKCKVSRGVISQRRRVILFHCLAAQIYSALHVAKFTIDTDIIRTK